MKFEMNNVEYNFVLKRLKRLEEAYNQTIDPSIRIAVKDQTCYELYERVPEFYNIFGNMLENCKMSSLKEITDITDKISESLEIGRLQEVDVQTAKKILKMKQKQLMLFLKAYNEAVKKENLTYFSARQDNKFIIMTYKDEEYYGIVSDLPKDAKHKKSLCCFCNSFRNGDEIVFATNTLKKSNGEYSSVGQYCCSNYKQCNKDIVDSDKLIEFLSYGKKYDKIK